MSIQVERSNKNTTDTPWKTHANETGEFLCLPCPSSTDPENTNLMKRAQMACSSSISSGAASSPENGITSSLAARRRRRHLLTHRRERDPSPSPSRQSLAATITALTIKMLLNSRGRAWKSTQTTRTRGGTGDGGTVRREASSEGSNNTREPGGGAKEEKVYADNGGVDSLPTGALHGDPGPVVRLITRRAPGWPRVPTSG